MDSEAHSLKFVAAERCQHDYSPSAAHSESSQERAHPEISDASSSDRTGEQLKLSFSFVDSFDYWEKGDARCGNWDGGKMYNFADK